MPLSIALLIAICVPVLLVGMALGYSGNSRAAVWRRRYEDERDHYADYRARSEARHARLVADGRAAAPSPTAAAPLPTAAVSLPTATVSLPSAPVPDTPPAAPLPIQLPAPALEITHIVGIDAPLAARLAALGVTTIRDIATLTLEDELALELRLGLNAGTITRDQWRPQAQVLDPGPAACAGTGGR